jgi:hypothetical protein
MADYKGAFETSFGETDAAQFLTGVDADPIGIINFFETKFYDILAPLISVQSGPISNQPFMRAAVSEYGTGSRTGWEKIIPPYIDDLNAGFFQPRSAALPPPAPATTAPPIVGATSNLYRSLLDNTVPPEAARKLTNALFSAIEADLIAAGPAGPDAEPDAETDTEPITVLPYIAIPA